MDIHEKAAHNIINNNISWIGSNNTTNIARKCEICDRATSSMNDYICEECRNEIRRLFREHRNNK